ncbi:MAG: sensor histidine kinase [Alphaproteobacteria bacterium]
MIKTKARFKLRSILLVVNLTVLILPLVGLFFFRFYENVLIQQTESELISQGAVIAAIYKNEIKSSISADGSYGISAAPESLNNIDEYYTPINPQIDFSTAQLLPSRPDGVVSVQTSIAEEKIKAVLSPILEDAKRTTLSGVRVLNYQGIVVAGRSEIGVDFSGVYEVEKALSGYYTSVIRQRVSDNAPPAMASISRGTGIRLFVAFPMIEDGRVWGVVYLSRTPQNILKHLYAEKEKVIIAGLTLVALTLLIALLTSYTISKPIHRLIRRTREFSEGNKEAFRQGRVSDVQEIEWLSQSFSNMAKLLDDRSEYIKDFAMHVSHEFKTPMTSIQGSAELLLEHLDDMEDEKKRKFLSNIITDSDRLKRLVKRLLDLAKADNVQATQEISSINQVLEALEGRYKDLGLTLQFDLDDEYVHRISREHLETIFSNLCDNALQHGASNMSIEAQENKDGLSLIICDDGTGISKANLDNVFTPFFTTRRQDGGTGLGLGIVQSLLHTHDGDIKAIQNERGACLFINFFQRINLTMEQH